ncbi:hypothetical protein H2198_008484 [Neophaeococcomyces mojaviensis]|uniref:Uncharacterized protein n=1 Tax=Neophaeococcomyces mojaviensis TaxID=3383035 RepID=A0ACC2ZX34_9EURO|nr:hypothetical protein H2198_008484 [Knufia sp. JES_112]
MYQGTPRKWKERERTAVRRGLGEHKDTSEIVPQCNEQLQDKSETMERYQAREGRELTRWLHDARGGGKSKAYDVFPEGVLAAPPNNTAGRFGWTDESKKTLGIATLNALEYWQA